ncbi:MAG: thiamine diphosphokinase [Clostridiales bacterium]|nr:thiamine diphosphokinase [Clostridiales bacterium]
MDMPDKRFVIFTALWSKDAGPSMLPQTIPGDLIACADGGYTVCASAGIRPDIVIGDFDSLTAQEISGIEAAGIERVVHPCEKDDTDTMLCAKYGLSRGFGRFLIVGGIGGSFGHTMANLQTLSFLTDMECEAMIVTDRERLFMADGEAVPVGREAKSAEPAMFSGRPGAKFSVLSYAERSSGVYIKNAKYGLSDAVLTQSYPVGVDNEFINTGAVTVSVRYGRLLIIADL